MKCDHKTEGEYAICNRCTTFERIARSAKGLIDIRKVYLNNLFIPGVDNDSVQEALREATKNLEQAIRFADDANLWE